MNALKKLSELFHTSLNRKARPVVEGEHAIKAGTSRDQDQDQLVK
jgi:hypothetical protein